MLHHYSPFHPSTKYTPAPPACLGDLAQRQALVHQVAYVLMLRRPLLALHRPVGRLRRGQGWRGGCWFWRLCLLRSGGAAACTCAHPSSRHPPPTRTHAPILCTHALLHRAMQPTTVMLPCSQQPATPPPATTHLDREVGRVHQAGLPRIQVARVAQLHHHLRGHGQGGDEGAQRGSGSACRRGEACGACRQEWPGKACRHLPAQQHAAAAKSLHSGAGRGSPRGSWTCAWRCRAAWQGRAWTRHTLMDGGSVGRQGGRVDKPCVQDRAGRQARPAPLQASACCPGKHSQLRHSLPSLRPAAQCCAAPTGAHL